MWDILIAAVDGLKCFPEAISNVFRQAQVQTCIVHMVLHSLRFVPWKDRKEVAKDLNHQKSDRKLESISKPAYGSYVDQGAPGARHHLAAILALHSKLIGGWSLKSLMPPKLVLDALKMTADRRKQGPWLGHHSGQGSQQASNNFQPELRSHQMNCRIRPKGDCRDNAAMESWFHSLKIQLELLYYQAKK